MKIWRMKILTGRTRSGWLNKCRWENELGTVPPNTERRTDPRKAASDAIMGVGNAPLRRESGIVDLDRDDWRDT